MPKGIPKSGVRKRERKRRIVLTDEQRAAILAEWDGNIRKLGISEEDVQFYSCHELRFLLREAGLPVQIDYAVRYGVGPSVISYLVRRKPHIGGRQMQKLRRSGTSSAVQGTVATLHAGKRTA